MFREGGFNLLPHNTLFRHTKDIIVGENIVRKGETACNKPFLTMCSTLYGTYFSFQMDFKMSSAICFNLDQSKILSSGNHWLTVESYQTID